MYVGIIRTTSTYGTKCHVLARRSKNAAVTLASVCPALKRLMSKSCLNKCSSGMASSKPPRCSHSRHILTRENSSETLYYTGDPASASNSRMPAVVILSTGPVSPSKRHAS